MKLGSVTPALLPNQLPSCNAIQMKQKFGNMLRTMHQNDIQAIADKMSRIVFERLLLDDPTQAQKLSDGTSKSVFLSSTPFKDSLSSGFQYGRNTLFFENEPYSFFYEYIFDHLKTASTQNLMKPQLTQWPAYIIHLKLDIEESERQGTLVFTLTETNEIDTLSHVSFTCEDLAIENSNLLSSRTELQKDQNRILREIDVCKQTQKKLQQQLLDNEQQLTNLRNKLSIITEKLENCTETIKT